ncbi:hypothetical protein DFJ73DRAFT_900601 [Zopfochytrium polystomum]|nr:hypothetical protein DFJ73DRAFT_900601 [Zopfochytrium polystomum]
MSSDYGIYLFLKNNDKGHPNAHELVATSAFFAAHSAVRNHLLNAVPDYDLHEAAKRNEPIVPDFQHVVAGAAGPAAGERPVLYRPLSVLQDGQQRKGDNQSLAMVMHGGGVAGLSALGYGRVGTASRVHLSAEQTHADPAAPMAGTWSRLNPAAVATLAPTLVFSTPAESKQSLELSFLATPAAPNGVVAARPILRRGLYSGMNGLAVGASEISGVLKVRNTGKKTFAVGSIRIELDATWYTKLTAKRYLAASGTNYIGMEPLTMQMAQFVPIEACGPITLAPKEEFAASFSFPLAGALPPSVDLHASLHGAPATKVSYKLTATALDAKANVAANKLRDTVALSYDVPVPHVSAELAETLIATADAAGAAASLTASVTVPGPSSSLVVDVQPSLCTPGDLLTVRVRAANAENGNSGPAVRGSLAAATLVEFAAHKESPTREPGTPRRRGEKPLAAALARPLLPAGTPSPAASAATGATGETLEIVVPPWTVEARQHAPAGIDARVWVEGGCVNPSGRWMNVVVGHEVVVDVVLPGGEISQVSVPVRVASVGLHDVPALREAVAVHRKAQQAQQAAEDSRGVLPPYQ